MRELVVLRVRFYLRGYVCRSIDTRVCTHVGENESIEHRASSIEVVGKFLCFEGNDVPSARWTGLRGSGWQMIFLADISMRVYIIDMSTKS